MLEKARNRFRASWDVGTEVWQGLLPAERQALVKTGISLLLIAVVEVVSVASLFPLIYAAIRAIKHDERLVRSADRFR